jgi:hypothetical protein
MNLNKFELNYILHSEPYLIRRTLNNSIFNSHNDTAHDCRSLLRNLMSIYLYYSRFFLVLKKNLLREKVGISFRMIKYSL